MNDTEIQIRLHYIYNQSSWTSLTHWVDLTCWIGLDLSLQSSLWMGAGEYWELGDQFQEPW